VKRREDVEEQGEKLESAGGMRWLLTYADMITLLLAFFIILYSLSVIKQQRYEALVQALRAVFTGKNVQVAKIHKTHSAPYPLAQKALSAKPNKIKTKNTNIQVFNAVKRVIEQNKLQSTVKVGAVPEGVTVVFLNGILFANASAQIQPQAYKALHDIGAAIRAVSSPIVVQGYANKLPIDTPTYPSNWNLSADRASNVINYWVNQGIPPTRFMVEAFSSYAPLVPNASAFGLVQNRAVAVVILNKGVTNLRDLAYGPASSIKAHTVKGGTGAKSTATAKGHAGGGVPVRPPAKTGATTGTRSGPGKTATTKPPAAATHAGGIGATISHVVGAVTHAIGSVIPGHKTTPPATSSRSSKAKSSLAAWARGGAVV